MAKRRPGHTPELVPEYEEKIPVANKITLNPHHPKYERTILLPEPRGAKARKLTVKLLPFLPHLDKFLDEEGNVNTNDLTSFVAVAQSIWGQENFEEELLPSILGLDPSQKQDKEIIESLGFMGAFAAFIKAFSYLMSGADSEEFEAALKKSDGGEVAEVADGTS